MSIPPKDRGVKNITYAFTRNNQYIYFNDDLEAWKKACDLLSTSNFKIECFQQVDSVFFTQDEDDYTMNLD